MKRIICNLKSPPHWRMASKPHRQFKIAVEGNIGSGKTTLLNYFRRFAGVDVLEEPVSQWRDLNGCNLLELMYADPSRWSLTFQTYVQLTMLKMHMDSKKAFPIRLMERSIHSAKYCFVENLHRSGLMPDAEMLVLTEWFNWIVLNLDVRVDLIVYLQTRPEVVHERIARRNRPEEKTIPMSYLQALHELHEEWLIRQKGAAPASKFLHAGTSLPKILVVDANKSQEELLEFYERNKQLILYGVDREEVKGANGRALEIQSVAS